MKLPTFTPGDAVPVTQKLGGEVPDLSLVDLAGRRHTLSDALADRKGAVVVFWSGVCSHCVRYDEYLNQFTANHPELSLLVVASRNTETPDDIRVTVAERKLKFPILVDSGSATAAAWFVQQTPRVFLVDASRRLHYRGAIDNFRYADDTEFEGYLEPAIAEFLAGEPVSRPETPSFGCAIKSVYYVMPKPI